MTEIIFWLLIILIVYCYFGYPILLVLVSSTFSQRVDKKHIEPGVSIVISLYNEEDVIKKKIENLLSADYPQEKIEILIGSDGSTDKTLEWAQAFRDKRIRVFDFKERRGKMAVVNDLVAKAQNEIIVFTDARQEFAPDAIRELVANFADPRVGCVSGELMFFKKDDPTAKGVDLYWRYEKFLRYYESRLYSMLGATGAIYALRRELYAPIPERVVLDDMYVPLKVIESGYRAIFEEKAKAYDQVATSAKEEYRRKARTLYGNYQTFGLFGKLFNPFQSPIAIQFFSHKLLRVLVPFFMVAVFGLNFFLLNQKFYQTMFVLQMIFYTMAIAGGLARNVKYGIFKPIAQGCYVPYVFCLLNFSALSGFLRFLTSRQEVTWQKARES